jgi:hypothetical protein
MNKIEHYFQIALYTVEAFLLMYYFTSCFSSIKFDHQPYVGEVSKEDSLIMLQEGTLKEKIMLLGRPRDYYNEYLWSREISQYDKGLKSTIDDYREIIRPKRTVRTIDPIITNRMYENIIPNNREEFEIFHSMYVSRKTNVYMKHFQQQLGKFALDLEDDFFELFLCMSRFVSEDSVDKEFYNTYYSDLELIISNNRDYFCKIYPLLFSDGFENLSRYFTLNCVDKELNEL